MTMPSEGSLFRAKVQPLNQILANRHIEVKNSGRIIRLKEATLACGSGISQQAVPPATTVIDSRRQRSSPAPEADQLAAFADLSLAPLATDLSSSSQTQSATPTKWSLWRYDCRDLPIHNKCFSKPCHFCIEVNKLRRVGKNKTEESKERYSGYLKKERDFENAQNMLNYVNVNADGIFPCKLVKNVYFNRKLGVAFFRDGIPPEYESAQNKDGGAFQLLLLATTGPTSRDLVRKFDALFKMTLDRIATGSPPLLQHVNGLFYRCEINPGKGLATNGGPNPYGNPTDLPFMAKLEIWIDDEQCRKLVETNLIDDIGKAVGTLGIPATACRSFMFCNRGRHWAEEVKNRAKK